MFSVLVDKIKGQYIGMKERVKRGACLIMYVFTLGVIILYMALTNFGRDLAEGKG